MHILLPITIMSPTDVHVDFEIDEVIMTVSLLTDI
jgi:hypothetical protein